MAEKRRIEEEDRASLDNASRASREPPAAKRKNDNTDLEEEEKFRRFERSRTVSMESDAATGLSRPADDDDFEAQMQDIDNMEFVDRKIIAATILGMDITDVYIHLSELQKWQSDMDYLQVHPWT